MEDEKRPHQSSNKSLSGADFAGVGLAILFNQSRLIEHSLYPYAVILQVTPIVAIAPLIIIYIDNLTIAHVNERVARLEAELVEQAKWREHPTPDIPEHVRDQAELWAGHARTELEWAKSLSKRLAEGAYTMADDPGSWRTVP